MRYSPQINSTNSFQMNVKILSFLLTLSTLGLFLTSCEKEPNSGIGEVPGLKPVYVNANDTESVTFEEPREIERAGKIYYNHPYFYVNEKGMGVHVVDLSDKANPQRLGFISIPGNIDLGMKGNVMYADSFTDLLAIDVSNYQQPQILKRIHNLYDETIDDTPVNYSGYFECVDHGKGLVVAWEETKLDNPNCRM